MVERKYDWENGVTLDKHTKKKHTILREYFRQYLLIRCQLPQMGRFRLVIVDGFSGAGLYKCGSYGSPLIFVDVLKSTLKEINIRRGAQGTRQIQIECLLILNDDDQSAVELLRKNISPLLAGIKEENLSLNIQIEFLSCKFDETYPKIKKKLESEKCENVLFNLDQYGHSEVKEEIIKDIMKSWRSAEAFLTFSITAFLAFISPDPKKNKFSQTDEMYQKINAIVEREGLINKKIWLGEVEKIIFERLKSCAKYVSPFSINNPSGWAYWLMHFANKPRAREAYNDILHENSMAQAHYGRSGLEMLSYDPKHEGQLYLFDENAREFAKNELHDDIPKLIDKFGGTLKVEEFYKAAYNETPAHSDDIHEMIIRNPDVEAITDSGGERRKPNTIKITDILKLKSQKSMFFMFSDNRKR